MRGPKGMAGGAFPGTKGNAGSSGAPGGRGWPGPAGATGPTGTRSTSGAPATYGNDDKDYGPDYGATGGRGNDDKDYGPDYGATGGRGYDGDYGPDGVTGPTGAGYGYGSRVTCACASGSTNTFFYGRTIAKLPPVDGVGLTPFQCSFECTLRPSCQNWVLELGAENRCLLKRHLSGGARSEFRPMHVGGERDDPCTSLAGCDATTAAPHGPTSAPVDVTVRATVTPNILAPTSCNGKPDPEVCVPLSSTAGVTSAIFCRPQVTLTVNGAVVGVAEACPVFCNTCVTATAAATTTSATSTPDPETTTPSPPPATSPTTATFTTAAPTANANVDCGQVLHHFGPVQHRSFTNKGLPGDIKFSAEQPVGDESACAAMCLAHGGFACGAFVAKRLEGGAAYACTLATAGFPTKRSNKNNGVRRFVGCNSATTLAAATTTMAAPTAGDCADASYTHFGPVQHRSFMHTGLPGDSKFGVEQDVADVASCAELCLAHGDFACGAFVATRLKGGAGHACTLATAGFPTKTSNKKNNFHRLVGCTQATVIPGSTTAPPVATTANRGTVATVAAADSADSQECGAGVFPEIDCESDDAAVRAMMRSLCPRMCAARQTTIAPATTTPTTTAPPATTTTTTTATPAPATTTTARPTTLTAAPTTSTAAPSETTTTGAPTTTTAAPTTTTVAPTTTTVAPATTTTVAPTPPPARPHPPRRRRLHRPHPRACRRVASCSASHRLACARNSALCPSTSARSRPCCSAKWWARARVLASSRAARRTTLRACKKATSCCWATKGRARRQPQH